MDLVYIVGPRAMNEELRYSLRTAAANFPHERVWIIGKRHRWLDNVEHIPTQQNGSKWVNSTANLMTALEHDEVSDPFVYMNDDFYFLERIEELPTLHLGSTDDRARYYRYTNSGYVTGLHSTAALLRSLGFPDPLSYEVHAPMVLDKAGMRRAIHTGFEGGLGLIAMHKRTLYGNLEGIGGERTDDVKVLSSGGSLPDGPLVSSNSQSWAGRLGRTIRTRFPEPGPYEKE